MQYKNDLEIEQKFSGFELENKDVAEDGSFSGWASVYGNVDEGGDVVEAGAFKDWMATKKTPKLLWQHDPKQIIGIWESVKDSEKGLFVKGRLLLDLPKAREAAILLKANAIDGLSIGYRAKDVDFKSTPKGIVRQIKSADLYEVSVVTFPMNPKALVTDVKQLQSPREVETILRNAGVPAAFAKLVANHGFEEAKSRLAKDQREADEEGTRRQAAIADLLNAIQGLKEIMKNG